MHEVLEVVMPQVDNVEEAITQIMKPFDENSSYEDDEDFSGHPFWDFWVIGGRWAGHKLTSCLDKQKMDSFYAELTDKKITVSGLQCGKQEISPSEQIPLVDEIWSSYFPEYNGRACPLFSHSNNQYVNDCLYGDVLRLKDTDENIAMSRIIFANENYDNSGLDAKEMFVKSLWNGVTHQDSAWDGTLKTAIEIYKKKIDSYKNDYKEKLTPNGDWIVVTVDYHT